MNITGTVSVIVYYSIDQRYNKERKLKYQLRKLGVNLEDAEGMDFKDLKGKFKVTIELPSTGGHEYNYVYKVQNG